MEELVRTIQSIQNRTKPLCAAYQVCTNSSATGAIFFNITNQRLCGMRFLPDLMIVTSRKRCMVAGMEPCKDHGSATVGAVKFGGIRVAATQRLKSSVGNGWPLDDPRLAKIKTIRVAPTLPKTISPKLKRMRPNYIFN